MSNSRPYSTQAESLTRSTRSARPPYLTEGEFRAFTSESRRRWQQNLDVNNAGTAPTAQSYSNRTPAQQSLYDWAAYNPDSDSDDDSTQEFMPNPHIYRRSEDEHDEQRELQSSLTESRRWRSQLRRDLEPRDEASGRVTLPSLQHLRRSVQDLPDSGSNNTAERTPAPRSPSVTAALSRLIERQRLERRERPWERREWPAAVSYREPDSVTDEERARVRRHLLDLRRRDRVAQRLDKSRLNRPRIPKTVNALKYLSGLRHCGDQVEVLNLAADLEVYGAQPSADLCPSDILISTNVLMPPQPSSFLTPGTTFTGVQRAPQEPPAALLNRDRDYLRRMVANRNLNFSSIDLPGAVASAEEFASAVLASAGVSDRQRMGLPYQASSRQAYIQGRLDRVRSSRHDAVQSQQAAINGQEQTTGDSWPVSVTLHTLSLHAGDMTISGTMSASQIPDKLSPSSPDHKPEGSSMESYFEGEIIDFNRHSLETNADCDTDRPHRFPVCGLEVDARYWSGVGPFRVVAEMLRRKRDQQRKASRESVETVAEIEREEEELEKEVDDEIARCLVDRKWMEKAVGGEGEWMLMRWKGKLASRLNCHFPLHSRLPKAGAIPDVVECS
jgi:Vacuolar import and degradation protein